MKPVIPDKMIHHITYVLPRAVAHRGVQLQDVDVHEPLSFYRDWSTKGTFDLVRSWCNLSFLEKLLPDRRKQIHSYTEAVCLLLLSYC